MPVAGCRFRIFLHASITVVNESGSAPRNVIIVGGMLSLIAVLAIGGALYLRSRPAAPETKAAVVTPPPAAAPPAAAPEPKAEPAAPAPVTAEPAPRKAS